MNLDGAFVLAIAASLVAGAVVLVRPPRLKDAPCGACPKGHCDGCALCRFFEGYPTRA